MKFTTVKSSRKAEYTVYLYSQNDDLKGLSLTDQEQKYIHKINKGDKCSLARINRYANHLVVVYCPDSSRKPYEKEEQLRLAGNKVFKSLKDDKVKSLTIESLSGKINPLALAEGLVLSSYQFLKYFSDKKERQHPLAEINLVGATQEEVNDLSAITTGVFKARDLVNEPVIHLTALQLAKEAQKAGEQFGFKVEVLNKKKIETLKMGGLLAVNKGSQDPPTFTIMEHQPADALNKKPIILVGKGVVYDTGGLSLKPTAGSMDSMKSDMGGAAAVVGTMISVAKAKLPLHIIGMIPATDNRPGQRAYTPGDVIRMYDGSTVEVLNTDAEGRMILADALAYAKKYKPEVVIDLATLTGAAAVAIGKYGIVAMGNADENYFEQIERAGRETYERIARFPFWDEYNELLKSSIADVKNIGGREGGAITAGKFLERFTDYPYVHLDIAGPAFLASDHDYRLQGGSGVGVRLLYNFLKHRS